MDGWAQVLTRDLRCDATQNCNGQLGLPNHDAGQATDFPWPGKLRSDAGLRSVLK